MLQILLDVSSPHTRQHDVVCRVFMRGCTRHCVYVHARGHRVVLLLLRWFGDLLLMVSTALYAGGVVFVWKTA
jgi:hypothetical protein